MAEDDKAETANRKTRRHHTRSRAGCSPCKKRHTRCDEAKPSCLNCKSTFRQCHYPGPVLPLRERRKYEDIVAGSQDVWVVTTLSPVENASNTSRNANQKTPSGSSSEGSSRDWTPPSSTFSMKLTPPTAAKTFDTYAINMPFESEKLIRYFYHAADAFGVTFEDPKDDCLATVVHDPASFRSTLLIASIHYAWNAGSLSEFEATFLFHKVNAIRSVNEWLHNTTANTIVDCVRQITTLSLAEASMGNVALAESHLKGLMAVVDANTIMLGTERNAIENELINRYLLLVSTFVYVFKSRMHDIAINSAQNATTGESTTDGSGDPIRAEHQNEYDGLHIRLMTFRLVPFFFAPPPEGVQPQLIDAAPYLVCMRAITDSVNKVDKATTLEQYSKIWNDVWMEGGATRMFYVAVRSHCDSIAGKTPATQGPMSSWVSMNAAASIFFNCLLQKSNAGELMDEVLFDRILLMIDADLLQMRQGPNGLNQQDSDLWLWKAFIGLVGVHFAESSSIGRELELGVQKKMFESHVGWWVSNDKVTWGTAREALGRVVWPSGPSKETFSQSVWQSIPLP